MIFVYILGVSIGLIIQIVVAKQFEKVAEMKGHDAEDVHAFAMCFWLGLIGWIYVAALPDRTAVYRLSEVIKANRPAAPAPAPQPKPEFDNEELPTL